MNQDALLELELRILMARHGRKKVLDALSRIKQTTVAALASDVKAFEDTTAINSRPGRRWPRKSVREIVRDLNLMNDEVGSLVEKLGIAYESRAFLPVLRDVKTFLEKKGVPAGEIRSRTEALPILLATLSRLSTEELRSIDIERLDTRSDLAIIADHVLGRRRTSTPSPDHPRHEPPEQE